MHTTLSRTQAVATHLLISVIIFLGLAYLIYFIWFPNFLFWTDGGIEGIQIIAGVDIVLGPFLTLCIYKAGKKGLKKDLAIIAAIQASALIYGVWVVYQQRTIAIFFSDHSFHTADWGRIASIEGAEESVRRIPGKLPKLIYASDGIETTLMDIEKSAYYYPLEDHFNEIVSLGFKPDEFLIQFPEFQPWLDKYSKEYPSVLLYPFTSKYGIHNSFLIVDIENKKIVGHWRPEHGQKT